MSRTVAPSRRLASALAAVVMVVALAACNPQAAEPEEPADSSAPSEEASAPADTSDAELMVADSSLGEIVVDGEGMTVYMFDDDTQGATVSTCEGQCAENWPAVTTDSDAPAVEGVTGAIGTITGVDGAMQVTVNGWPLYYFAGDEAAGDINGQGVGGIWWVLSPEGERMAE